MLTGLQWTHLIPTGYMEGPVLAVHLPHSGPFTSRVRFPHTTVFKSLTLAEEREHAILYYIIWEKERTLAAPNLVTFSIIESTGGL